MTNLIRHLGIAAAAALTGIVFAAPARAGCQCVCMNGEVEAVCLSSLDIQPIGASKCRSEQVWNGREYEWVEICR